MSTSSSSPPSKEGMSACSAGDGSGSAASQTTTRTTSSQEQQRFVLTTPLPDVCGALPPAAPRPSTGNCDREGASVAVAPTPQQQQASSAPGGAETTEAPALGCVVTAEKMPAADAGDGKAAAADRPLATPDDAIFFQVEVACPDGTKIALSPTWAASSAAGREGSGGGYSGDREGDDDKKARIGQRCHRNNHVVLGRGRHGIPPATATPTLAAGVANGEEASCAIRLVKMRGDDGGDEAETEHQQRSIALELVVLGSTPCRVTRRRRAAAAENGASDDSANSTAFVVRSALQLLASGDPSASTFRLRDGDVVEPYCDGRFAYEVRVVTTKAGADDERLSQQAATEGARREEPADVPTLDSDLLQQGEGDSGTATKTNVFGSIYAFATTSFSDAATASSSARVLPAASRAPSPVAANFAYDESKEEAAPSTPSSSSDGSLGGDDLDSNDISDPRQEIIDILQEVDSPGTFAVGGSSDGKLTMPGLVVDGVGTIGLPLSEGQARDLAKRCEQAPFGRGSKTVVDTSVRNTFQLNPKYFAVTNPSWGKEIDDLTEQACRGLGVQTHLKVEAQLYKLLLYEEGSFFKPHRDSEKVEGMFGTLVVVLPSRFTGGELVIMHKGGTESFDQAASSSFGSQYAAFYADCKHELKAVTSGHRLCLVYNLVKVGAGPRPTAASNDAILKRLRTVAQAWAKSYDGKKCAS